ncbi:MAG TPA: metallophosphoesterase [Gemmatimonadaceae bacterium]|nr:metallophosphoesterase [Gemmatimonadaceae bacterium]
MPAAGPRWWGRARHAGVRKKAIDVALGLVYTGGWPAVITRAIGLQGDLQVSEHVFRIRRARADAPPLRLAYVSDFHAGPTVHPELMAAVLAAIGSSDVELLLLGGDFISFHARYVDRLIDGLERVTAPLGKFAVLGNHDLLGDDEYIVRRLADAGVTTLVNANARLAAPYDDIWVCGLDDWDEGEPDADRALHGADGTRIVLAHQPDALLSIGDRPFDIAFFGHVHGGQFLLDNRRPLISHRGPISKLYMHGGVFHAGVHDAPVLVSRGIGTSTLPARRHADPEVHLCTLVAKSEV